MKRQVIFIVVLLCGGILNAQFDWDAVAVPADAGDGNIWELQTELSDDFNYVAEATDKGETFNSKWKDSYVNAWTGGSGTTWQSDHSSVNGSMLVMDVDRKAGTTQEVISACVSARNTVVYPVFIETSAKLSNSVLASCFWMVSLDQTQEIDIIEAFGTDRVGKEWYATRQHLSHHVFIRDPFQDYQPTDVGSWYVDGTVWRNDFHRVGVYWKDSLHLEYYIDGKMVRVLHDKALANLKNGTWTYSYPTMTNGVLDKNGGYQALTSHSTRSTFSMDKLLAASAASSVSIIDAYGYTADGLTKPQHMLVTHSQQSWTNMYATDEELNNKDKAIYYLDWIRVYKPVDDGTGILDYVRGKAFNIYQNPDEERILIEANETIAQAGVFDMNGRLIFKEQMHGTKHEITTSALATGMYILRIQTVSGEVSSEKFVVSM